MMDHSSDSSRRESNNNFLTKWLAASLFVLLVWLGITTSIQVKEIQGLTDEVDTLKANVSTLASKISSASESRALEVTAIEARQSVETSSQLVPHPVYYNVLTLPMMHPNSTSLDKPSLEKRYNWWALGGIAKAKNDKQGKKTSDSSKIGCVYGAISTLITVAGAAWVGATQAAQIGLIFQIIKGVSRRDDGLSDEERTQKLIDYQTAMVNYTGLSMTPMFNMNGNLVMHNKSGMPLMFGYNGNGDGMMFSHRLHEGTNTSYMAYGIVPPPSANGKRDTYFNEEDFVSGGLEAGYEYNQDSDGGYLSTENDYAQMDHQVSCTYAGRLDNNAIEFQIYDNNHDGTIAAGNIRAYEYDVFDLASLQDPVYGLPEQPGCQVS